MYQCHHHKQRGDTECDVTQQVLLLQAAAAAAVTRRHVTVMQQQYQPAACQQTAMADGYMFVCQQAVGCDAMQHRAQTQPQLFVQAAVPTVNVH